MKLRWMKTNIRDNPSQFHKLTHYKNGEIPNESVIKTNVNYTQYKEQQEKALPKFKYYAKLMAELKKTLDEEVKPLLNH